MMFVTTRNQSDGDLFTYRFKQHKLGQDNSQMLIALAASIRTESNYLKKNLDTLDRVYEKIGKYK